MQFNIADDLGIDKIQVNIKATTTEKLGFEGAEQGIAASAVVLCLPI
jgi:2-C-methyl-D-erythritol 2,4-cyclodiphosphate synthase